MIRVLDLRDVLELTKTKALIWKKITDSGWQWSHEYWNYHRWQEYGAAHENFRLDLRVDRIGKKRSKNFPRLFIYTEDRTMGMEFSRCRRLLKITNLIIKTR